MKKTYIYFTAIGVLLAAGWAYWQQQELTRPVKETRVGPIIQAPVPEAKVPEGTHVKDPVQIEPERPAQVLQADRPLPPDPMPKQYRGFAAWPESKQLDTLEQAVRNPQLSPEVTSLFRHELFNRELSVLVRNNMANALVKQSQPDPELYKTFITMLKDETENPVWRDYCLQFLSECVAFTPPAGRAEILSHLRDHAVRTREDSAGTAAVHLALQEQLGYAELDADFNNRLAEGVEAADTPECTKLSMLAVIGKRKDKAQLPLIRKYACQDADAGLKRVAIAALGQMGEPQDIALVQASLKHSNRSVQMAAEGALRRLENANASLQTNQCNNHTTQ